MYMGAQVCLIPFCVDVAQNASVKSVGMGLPSTVGPKSPWRGVIWGLRIAVDWIGAFRAR